LNSEKLNIPRSEGKQMSSEPSPVVGLLGYAMGFALKKVLKLILIIVGFLALTQFSTWQALSYSAMRKRTFIDSASAPKYI
jgi:hypothetical protein